MWKTEWIAGPADARGGPVLVSVTDFEATRWLDVPRVYLAGLALRRAWPSMEGAVGMWLWAEPFSRRSGSVSVWKSEEDLRRFVRWDAHVAVVRRFRGRGVLNSTSWRMEGFVRGDAWSDAVRRLGEPRRSR